MKPMLRCSSANVLDSLMMNHEKNMDFDFFQADAYWHARARIKNLHSSNGELELNLKHRRSQMTISAIKKLPWKGKYPIQQNHVLSPASSEGKSLPRELLTSTLQSTSVVAHGTDLSRRSNETSLCAEQGPAGPSWTNPSR